MIEKEQSKRPRLAASSYLNTAPLIWSFLHGPQRAAVELLTDTSPARCAEMLSLREVDAALVPVIEYQRLPDLLIVPDVCVGSRSAVRSVVLATRLNNLKKVKRVALDDSSRTSVALLKIIFREFLGFEPEWETLRPDLRSMLRHADAALIIGDPAMQIPRDQFRVFDLATLWHEFTGLGFVFAMWMTRHETCEIDFAAARDEGLRHLDEIISNYESEIPLSRTEFQKYLTENIAYEINDSMQKGLELYFELASQNGLIEKLKPLKIIS